MRRPGLESVRRTSDSGNPMDRGPDRQLIARLLANAATRVETGPGNLAAIVDAACSPSRSDQFNAIAVEWLRRWRPDTIIVALPPCSCPSGRCESCN
jgi:hypothetical protein